MTVHLYCTNSWSKLVLAAIPPTLLCPGLSSLRVYSRWESHRTPALLLRNRGWVWRQWLSQAKWFYTFWLTNHNRGKQILSLDTLLICLFKNCVCAKLSGICSPFWDNVHPAPCFTCHMNFVKCQVYFLLFFFDKVLELVGGGSVINWAYPD